MEEMRVKTVILLSDGYDNDYDTEEIVESKKEKSGMDKKYKDLTKLKKLLDDKIITKEEFEKEKKKILKG